MNYNVRHPQTSRHEITPDGLEYSKKKKKKKRTFYFENVLT